MPDIVLPTKPPEGDDQELWRQMLEFARQVRDEVQAINSQIGRR